MRTRPLPPEFLEELRAPEKAQQAKREEQFEADRQKQLEKDRLRIAGLLAEKEIRRSAQVDYQKEVLGTDTLAEKLHGKGSTTFKRGQMLGRYKVISDGAMLVVPGDVIRGGTGTMTLRVRCVCGESKYVTARYARQQMKKDENQEWGCTSKKCLNAWREKQARRRKK